MFQVGRFDPDADRKTPNATDRNPKKKSKELHHNRAQNNSIKRHRKRLSPSDGVVQGDKEVVGKETQPVKRNKNGKVSSVSSYNDVDDSSSVPSSSSSDSESDNKHENSTARKSTLKVIAPAQAIVGDSISTKRRKDGFEEEAIDDFDADFDIVENSLPISSSQVDSTDPTGAFRNSYYDPVASRALRLSRLPIEEVASKKHWGLPSFLVKNLEADSYTNFFPIQCMVIPDVIESDRNAHLRGARDVCCHAPTGSGKTLAFVLPLLTALSNEISTPSSGCQIRARGFRRLRALVVLPGRDLAKQVYDVFVRYAKGSHIKTGLAVGGGKKKADLINERRSLVVESYNEAFNEIRDENGTFVRRKVSGLHEAAAARGRFEFDPTQIISALETFDGTSREDCGPEAFPQFGGRSAVDILVATPGRLMDHLDSTPGFTLQHLRFLVIDEADRLINQNNQNWVGRVLEASNSASRFDSSLQRNTTITQYIESPLQIAPDGLTYIIDPITHRLAGTGLTNVNFGGKENSEGGFVSGFYGRPVPLRKMLFSATLTQDPQKLARLGLVNPKHFDANVLKQLERLGENECFDSNAAAFKTGRYSVPEGLCEKMVECTAEQKPLVLLALLLDKQNFASARRASDSINLCVVFTSSIDSTHRLARLLQLLWVVGGFGKSSAIAEFSSSISAKQRATILRRCRYPDAKDKVSVLVCSDGMSRGMDLPSVSAVINYDVPAYAKTYVHRCGRTARAGKEGTAISVLKGGQVAKFRRMRNLIDGGQVEQMGIKKDLVKGFIQTYKVCVSTLKEVMEAEENKEILPTDPLDDTKWMPRR